MNGAGSLRRAAVTALRSVPVTGSVSSSFRVGGLPRTAALSVQSGNLSNHFLGSIDHTRNYATRKFQHASITESQYHELANTCLDALTDSLEELVEEGEGPEAESYEAEYASGVLNLRLGSHGTYVINKQPPNKQIWFSSPRSGPKRFDYDADHKAWFMLKDGQESNLRDLLNSELSDVFGREVKVDLGEGDR